MNPVPAFPSVADAMATVQAGLRFVAAADAILLSAAKAGMDLRDLAGLAAEMYERSLARTPGTTCPTTASTSSAACTRS